MNGELVRQNAPNLVRTIRATRPTTPILLVEDRLYTDNVWAPQKAANNRGEATPQSSHRFLLRNLSSAPLFSEPGGPDGVL
eukprot:SAG11_NODE_2898_length_2851_cov_3.351381_2_plen_81_part_00